MNLILLFQNDFINNTDRVLLQGRRFRHVHQVLRAGVGDELSVGLMNDRIGTGRIVAINDTSLEMDVRFICAPPQALPLTLLLALPRPKVVRRVLRSVTTLGVKRIILLNCTRVEKSFWQSPLLTQEAINEQLALGLEQARDTILPEVLLRPLFKPFVEDELPGMREGTVSLVAHPLAKEPCPRNINSAVTLAVGPEGGFIPYELEKLLACGFSPISLGERILSVETAVPALLSRLF